MMLFSDVSVTKNPPGAGYGPWWDERNLEPLILAKNRYIHHPFAKEAGRW